MLLSVCAIAKESCCVRQSHPLLAAVFAITVLCAAPSPARADDPTVAAQESTLDILVRQINSGAHNVAATASDVVVSAMSMLGVRYKFGGNSPETGLDCSGLVRLAFAQTFGMTLPRTSSEMSRVGDRIDKRELQPGDLVFFNTLRRAFSHVGIYVGDGKFVHAPSSGGEVRVESMNIPYWQNRFNGARRVSPDDGVTVQAAAVPAADLAPATIRTSTRAGVTSRPATASAPEREAP
jgi:cell wall-associated NlpC family hydrolase